MKTPQDLFDFLKKLSIEIAVYHHKPLFTVEQALAECGHIPGCHCKNLFLKDNKDNLWLVVMRDEIRVELKVLAKMLGVSRFSFGNKDLLLKTLGVEPGSVTLLGIINDPEYTVTVVLDKGLFDYPTINFHPLINSMTVGITADDLRKFLASCGNKVLELDLRCVNLSFPCP